MKTPNQDLINQFFEGYIKRDLEMIRKVMPKDVSWNFPGSHPFAGVKNGVEEVVAFFDAMGKVMSKSNPKVIKLVDGENDNYLLECHRVVTDRQDGINIDHHICVLWTFSNNKIISGKHFFSDPDAANAFFAETAE